MLLSHLAWLTHHAPAGRLLVMIPQEPWLSLIVIGILVILAILPDSVSTFQKNALMEERLV
jgi:hypothetical protein